MKHNPIVLLIDDDTDDQEIFSLALEKANETVNCVFANDGIDALEKLNSDLGFTPDYIFIDMNMPRMNGQQCLTEIKKIERLKNVPVYMYSTSADPESVAENKSLGATDFIVKPANINALSNILAKIVHNQLISVMIFIFCLSVLPQYVSAQRDTLPPVKELKKLSVEELMNIVVTSVSKSPEKLTEVASAIQVISGDEIRRSTSTRLPEALRLASNMQVAQSGSHDWGITSRGFNGLPASNTSLADKLLVLIDGRTVYTPLFGGVFWDVQNVLLEDVDRIEVVSGPGGTLWSTNAVNGVVNVISKNAKETQGVYASGALGSLMRDFGAVRYGSQIDSVLYFRVYAQRFDYNNTELKNGADALDSWNMTQGGFRMDYSRSAKNTFTLQGDLYSGVEDDTLSTLVNGQNITGRWMHSFSERSGLTVQTYFDRTYRNIKPSHLIDEINTYDIDIQHNLSVGKRHRFVWGVGYRLADDHIRSISNTYQPPHKALQLFNGFLQDRIAIVPDKVEFTLGSKLLHNDYTNFEVQPSARIAWTPTIKHTLWAAISRTVRTPTRFDADITFPGAPDVSFKSEKLIAYELGYRVRPVENISLSFSGFYNQYSDLRSIDSTITTHTFYYFANHLEANTYGGEFFATAIVTNWWKLRGGYSYLYRDFSFSADSVFPQTDEFESIDPQNQFILQSIADIYKGLQLDGLIRYVDNLPQTIGTPETDAYLTFNLRLGWQYKWITVSVNGQNLAQETHNEFGARKIPRSVYGKITIDF